MHVIAYISLYMRVGVEKHSVDALSVVCVFIPFKE